MNKILDKVLENRKGMYCHCLELGSVHEYESVIEAVCDEFREDYNNGIYSVDDFSEFFNSMSIYYYTGDYPENKVDEQELYDFSSDVSEYISEYLF